MSDICGQHLNHNWFCLGKLEWVLGVYPWKIATIRYSGKFRRCKISGKCCIHFRRNFCTFYFRISRTWQLTTPFECHASLPSLYLNDNFPQAKHFFAKNSGPAIPVGLVAFCHCLRRKPQRQSPPQSFCCLHLRKAHQMSVVQRG